MLPYRIAAPARVANWTAQNSTTALRDSLRQHNVSPILTTVRYATHQSEGRANGVKQGAGKRLGAKKTGGQYVVPGNIIFRQRGMNWYPGDNCNVGRDHTIFATQAGYVRYYRDPRRHANRQYIGVAFDKNDNLPQHPSAPRKRRLGMIPVKMSENEKQTKTFIVSNAEVPEGRGSELGFSGRDHEGRKGNNREAVIIKNRDGSKTKLTMAPSYAYREENWLLGRTAERAGLKPRKRANPILKRFRKRQKMLLERKGLFDEVKKRQKTYKTSGKAQALKRLSRRPQVGRMRSFAKLEKYNRERRQKQM